MNKNSPGYNSATHFKTRINGVDTKAYTTWRNMLRRCYSSELWVKHPTYRECTVVVEWHDFQVFAEWFEDNYIEGYQLDKDLLVPGNKVYGPDTCCFIPQEINKLFNEQAKTRGEYPCGVSKHNNRYRARIRIKGKAKHLGLYLTIADAYNAYKTAKEEYVKKVARGYRDSVTPEVYNALMEWYKHK